jgi:hypothetical protein
MRAAKAVKQLIEQLMQMDFSLIFDKRYDQAKHTVPPSFRFSGAMQ